MRKVILLLLLFAQVAVGYGGEDIAPSCTFAPGPINGVLIQRDGAKLAVYGWDGGAAEDVEYVLLPHGRRDLVWRARPLVEAGAKAVAPARESFFLEKPGDFWDAFPETRFHDYAQQTTKVSARPLAVGRWVKDGEEFRWQDLTFRVLETAGLTRGSVSYLVELDGQKLAFTGDMIYGDGKILDLYSFQDAIPEARIGGYHGYGSRLAGLIDGLRKVAAAKPDLVVPARGPVIRQPQQAIERLIGRVQALYKNYLSTNALHWYFKEERMRISGERVLGEGAEIELMPYCRHEQTPDWVFEESTSRLILSESGHGLLLDCGYQRVIDAVDELIDGGIVKQVDGIFATHFHDDHTNMVQAAAEKYDCPVYATREYADVLENPGAYHLPCLTSEPILNVTALEDGHTMRWHEFELTFHFFPGQTYYHGALMARKPGKKPILFVGDSFAPSGLDDYCVRNRNLVHDDAGYLRCLAQLRAEKSDFWLVNQHIQYVFAFSPEELDYLEKRYRRRIGILRELFPWDDPNYGIDPRWAVLYPHGVRLAPGQSAELELRLTNHSPEPRTFRVTARGYGGLKLQKREAAVTLAPRESGAAKFRVQAGGASGNHLVTADVLSDGMEFREWAEALVTIE